MTRLSKRELERRLENISDETPPPGLVGTRFEDMDPDELAEADFQEMFVICVRRHYQRTDESLADYIAKQARDDGSSAGECDE